MESLREDLDRHGAPDLLTLYLFGTDLYAHEADVDPERALETCLCEVLDARLGELDDHLQRLGELDDRFVVVVREPAPFADDDGPFEVYLGGGRTGSIEDHLRVHPQTRTA